MVTTKLPPARATKTTSLHLTVGAAKLQVRAYHYEIFKTAPWYQPYSAHRLLRGRPAAPTINTLKAMRQAFGPLVFLRRRRFEDDHISIVTGQGRRAHAYGSRCSIYGWASVNAKGLKGRKLICAIHRDVVGNIHDHFVIPLAALSKHLRELISDAPEGKGGGLNIDARMHAVLIGDTEADLEAVGHYMCRHPQALPTRVEDQAELLEQLAEQWDENNGERAAMIWHSHSRWRPGFCPT